MVVLAQDNAEDPQEATGEVNLSREGGIGTSFEPIYHPLDN
jgi:hypothetical protein